MSAFKTPPVKLNKQPAFHFTENVTNHTAVPCVCSPQKLSSHRKDSLDDLADELLDLNLPEGTKMDLKLRRKLRKMNREKKKRLRLNDKFDQLSRMLQLTGNTRIEKLTILVESIQTIADLQKERDELTNGRDALREEIARLPNAHLAKLPSPRSSTATDCNTVDLAYIKEFEQNTSFAAAPLTMDMVNTDTPATKDLLSINTDFPSNTSNFGFSPIKVESNFGFSPGYSAITKVDQLPVNGSLNVISNSLLNISDSLNKTTSWDDDDEDDSSNKTTSWDDEDLYIASAFKSKSDKLDLKALAYGEFDEMESEALDELDSSDDSDQLDSQDDCDYSFDHVSSEGPASEDPSQFEFNFTEFGTKSQQGLIPLNHLHLQMSF